MFEMIKKLFRRKDNPNKKSMPNSYPTPSVPAGANNQFLDDMMFINAAVFTITAADNELNEPNEPNECECDVCSPLESPYNEHDGSDEARDDSPSYESSHSSDVGSSYDSGSSCDCGGGGCGGD